MNARTPAPIGIDPQSHDRKCLPKRRSSWLHGLALIIVLGSAGCDQPQAGGLSDAQRSDMAAQIKAELEDERCAVLFLIGRVHVSAVREMRGGAAELVLEARGVASLRLGPQQELDTLGCNTLALLRRVRAVRAASNGSLDVPVRAYFTQDASRWRLEAADFDD